MSSQGNKLASTVGASVLVAVACGGPYRVGANFEEGPGQNPAVTSLGGSANGSDTSELGPTEARGGAAPEPSEGGAPADIAGSSTGGSKSLQGGNAAGGSASGSAGGALDEPPLAMDDWEPVGVGGDANATFVDQSPPQCGDARCASGDVCNPGVGCEAACEVVGGVDATAPWPLGGGCATRRGLSRYAGARSAHELWRLDADGFPTAYQSAVTLGPGHTSYTAYRDSQDQEGFLHLSPSGRVLRRFEDWLAPCPVLAADGVLLTAPAGLRATSLDGTVLWETSGPMDQTGELALGADGTIYIAGNGAEVPALFAFTPAGKIAWRFDLSADTPALNTWPAVAPSGTIYIGDGHGTLHAISSQGQELWQGANGSQSRTSVAPGGIVYGTTNATFTSFDEQGHERFRIDAPGDQSSFSFREVAIGPDHTAYVNFRTYLNGEDDPSSGVRAYTPNGDLKWTFSRPFFGVTTPVVDREGTVYVGIGGHVYAVNPDGSELWDYHNDSDADANGVAIGSDGTTYLAFQGRLVALHD